MRKLVILFLTIVIVSCSMPKTSDRSDSIIIQDSVMVDSAILDNLFILDSVSTKEKFFKNLSYSHNFKLTFFEHYKDGEAETHYWEILIYDKKMNLVDSILQPVYAFYSEWVDFTEPDSYRSYITGINKNKQAIDNYYGLFIVADFNFDAKNDFAIINDMGGNGGTFNSYYIQHNDNKFVLDTFLTDSMMYFPSKIDVTNRQLTTYVHAGVCWMGEHVYELDKNNKWKEISHKTIDVLTGEITHEKK